MTVIAIVLITVAQQSEMLELRLAAVILALFGSIAWMRVGLDKVKETFTHVNNAKRWIGLVVAPVFVYSFWNTTTKLLEVSPTYSPLVDSVRLGVVSLAILYAASAVKLIYQQTALNTKQEKQA